jgi:hypothetical protein
LAEVACFECHGIMLLLFDCTELLHVDDFQLPVQHVPQIESGIALRPPEVQTAISGVLLPLKNQVVNLAPVLTSLWQPIKTMLLYLMFMMSIVPQVREINITLIQNRVDSYIFYSHVTHYTRTYKSLFSNTPQGLNFQQGRSKYMFLSVFINSCIPTACHVLGTANTRLPNILSWHPTK